MMIIKMGMVIAIVTIMRKKYNGTLEKKKRYFTTIKQTETGQQNRISQRNLEPDKTPAQNITFIDQLPACKIR